MKNLVILIAIAAIAAVGYYVVWPNMQADYAVTKVTDRVEGWLAAQKQNDEQTGLSMWAEGVVTLDEMAMRAYSTRYDQFRRTHDIYDNISSYSIDFVEPPFANVTINGMKFKLRVVPRSPISVE